MKLESIFPFLIWFRLTTLESIKADFLAGLTGAVIVLPQGVAFATIAGLPPEYGLYTAMVTPIVAALYGSSFHLVSGPTTAISIVVFSTISHHTEPGSAEFLSLTLTLTFLAGVYQLGFGLARLGSLVNFVSHTVVIGFTAGAAILIATSQIKHVTGIAVEKGHTFIETWIGIFQGINQINSYLFLIAFGTLITAIATKKLAPKMPNLLIAMTVGSVLAYFLNDYTTEIKMVGEIPAHLPPFSLPEFSFERIKMLAPEAFAVALLGLIEAVSISRSVANKSNQRIDANQEFIGQGLSNIFGSFFSSYAGSGSFTRTGVNYEAGAKTPLSAIIAALTLMIIVMLVSPLTAYLPTAAMGGIILVVAYNLIDFHHISEIFHFNKSEVFILLATFFATLFLELEFAIYIGVLLSLVLFLSKTSTPNIVTLSIDNSSDKGNGKFINIQKKSLKECPQLKIIRIDMSVYFGSVTYIQRKITQISDHEGIKHILIVASGINFIDLAGAETLVTEHKRLRKQNGSLYFVDLKSSVSVSAAKSHFDSKIGEEVFFESKSEAINQIYKRLDKSRCANCQLRIFKECD